MIDFVEIKNYKCFEDTKIEGFERVNLIGGLNNAGKTVLLEALHLGWENPQNKIALHRKLRGENENPHSYEYLFYKNNVRNKIEISFQNQRLFTTLIYDEAEELKVEFPKQHSENRIIRHFEERGLFVTKIVEYNHFYRFPIDNFLAPSEIFNSEQLVLDYNKIEEKSLDNKVLEFLQSIDKSISDIRVSIQGGAHLRVKKGNDGIVPLTALGDAAKRVARIAITALSGDHKVIFIDEIENGIHYTAHHEFWRLLFHLAQSLDLQVFATTHSLEMIKAFHKIAVEKEVKDATYFELFRHGRTDKIVGKKQSIETLTYRLERNLELRGE